jgi:4-carboxymuconolactone decarboxylase
MVRIPLPEPESMTADQRRVFDAIAGLRGGHIPTPYRAALHNPELADKWQQIGELLRYRTSLPQRLSELAVLVVARHHDCQYIWNAHEHVALKVGVASEAVAAIKVGRRPSLPMTDEHAVYSYCAELLETKFVANTTHAQALGALGVTGIVELTALLGYYVMVAMTLNAHELPLPPGVDPPLAPVSRI